MLNDYLRHAKAHRLFSAINLLAADSQQIRMKQRIYSLLLSDTFHEIYPKNLLQIIKNLLF